MTNERPCHLDLVLEQHHAQPMMRRRRRLRRDENGALDRRRSHSGPHVAFLMLGCEQPHASEQVQLIKAQA